MNDETPPPKLGDAINRAAAYALLKGKRPREVFEEARGHLSKLGGEERFRKTLDKWRAALGLNRK